MKVLTTIKHLFNNEMIQELTDQGIDFFEADINDLHNINLYDSFKDINIIVGGEELKELPITEFSDLKLIQTISAGFDYLDKTKITNNNIKLTNASGVYSIPIAEWVIGQILYAFKKFDSFKESQIKHNWNPDYSLEELNEKKVLIFGTGSIGQEICKRLNVFNCEVDGINSDGRSIKGFNNCCSLEVSSDHISDYDILVFALPSNSKTKNFLNKTILEKIPNSCVLINVGRGDLINENDLIEVLEIKKDMIVFLDVLKQEPLPKDEVLWDHPQIFVTPHTSFSSTKNQTRLRKLVISNIMNLKNNKRLINEIK
jgi:phosphoglycerate dehydrogenase-like enzyme